MREAAEAEARRKLQDANRQRYEQEKQRRRDRMHQAREQRAMEREEALRVNRYRRAGFSPLGLDVLISKVGFHYRTEDGQRSELNYHPLVGFDYIPVENKSIDFSRMTISGSVLNATNEIRNIGIAIRYH